MLENRVLMEIFGPKRHEGIGEWRRLRNEELHGLFCSPNIVRVIKSRRMGWAGHVARMERGEAHAGFWWGDLRIRDRLEDLGVDGRVMLKWI
jgi:hypothetical protein